jgi:hypothetical protein
MSELVTVAEPVIPKAPWISGPFLYGAGLFLHYVWLYGVWERIVFSLIFAGAGAVIGRFAAEYGKARTSFQRTHAALTPPLFSLIISVPLIFGWGRYTSLLMFTYWVVLAGGWVARVARSVWGDGADMHGPDAAAALGEVLGLPGVQVGGGRTNPSTPVTTSRRLRRRALPAGPGTGFVDSDNDGRDDVTGNLITRRVTVRGVQGFEDIVRAAPSLRNAARADHIVVRPVKGNPQAGDVTLVMNDLLVNPTPYPGPSRPAGASAGESVCVGVRQDGDLQTFPLAGPQGTFRGVIAGSSGSGKSRLLWLFLAELSARRDIVVWISDAAKAGQTVGPARGMVDWLVTSIEETEDMLDAAARIVSARAASMGDAQAWTPDCGLPLLLIECEEFANVATASKKISDKFTRLSEQARSVGIVLIFSIQRPSGKNMPTDARAQLPGRFCFGLQDEQSPKMVLSPSTLSGGAQPELVDTETMFGVHWYEGPGIPASAWMVPARTYAIEADQLRALVTAGASYRCQLDEVSARAAGEAYRQRTHPGVKSPQSVQDLPDIQDVQSQPQSSAGPESLKVRDDIADPRVAPEIPRQRSVPARACAELFSDTEESQSAIPQQATTPGEISQETRPRSEILGKILATCGDGVVTTADLVARWERETTLNRRAFYRALNDSPLISSSGHKGVWLVQGTSTRRP